MKRKRISGLLGGTSTVVFAMAGVPLPGCESMMFDPQAFLTQNTCNIFNCDTLFFLQGEHDEMLDDHDDSDMDDDHDGMEMDGTESLLDSGG